MVVGIALRKNRRPGRIEQMHVAGPPVRRTRLRHHPFAGIKGALEPLRIPAERGGMGVDIDLACLHAHALVGGAVGGAVEIEPLMERAAGVVETGRRPQRQRARDRPFPQLRDDIRHRSIPYDILDLAGARTRSD